MQENTPNRLAQKLDAMDQPEGFDTTKLWTKLETTLVSKQRTRRSGLYVASAAAAVLVLMASLLVRYAALPNHGCNTTKATPEVITIVPTMETPAFNSIADTARPVRATAPKAIEKPAGIAMNNAIPITDIGPSTETSTDALSSLAPAFDTMQPAIITATIPPAKKPLKVMHINEINYENGQRAREEQLYNNDPFTYSGDQLITAPPEESKTPIKKLVHRLSTQKLYNN